MECGIDTYTPLGGAAVQSPPDNAGDAGGAGWISGLGRSSGGGNGNPLQYSCLGNSMNRGARVHGGHKTVDTTERPSMPIENR